MNGFIELLPLLNLLVIPFIGAVIRFEHRLTKMETLMLEGIIHRLEILEKKVSDI